MDKRDVIWYILPVAAVAALVLWLLFPPVTRAGIPLFVPRPHASAAPSASVNPADSTVELNADTVQTVIATLSRPAAYTRTYRVTLFWDGGQQSETVAFDSTQFDNATATDKDIAARIPTYEDVLALDRADIIAAEYSYVRGVPFIRVRFNGLLYEHEYDVSIATGLLEYARKYKDGVLVYDMTVDNS